jgi:hypothetical protein
LPEGYIIAIRLGEGNKSVLDYLFLPTREMIGIKIRFTETGLPRFSGHLFATPAHLAKAVLHQFSCRTSVYKTVIKSGRTSRAMSRRPKREQTKSRPKGGTGHGRR